MTTALRAVKATTAPELRAIARAVAPTDCLSQSQKNVLNVGLALPRRDRQGRSECVWPSFVFQFLAGVVEAELRILGESRAAPRQFC